METRNQDIERIAIINHDNHQLFVVDIANDILLKKYDGEEEAYIKDNFPNLTNYSWDYITDAEYTPCWSEVAYDIIFEEIAD